jgi:hypothetical protein
MAWAGPCPVACTTPLSEQSLRSQAVRWCAESGLDSGRAAARRTEGAPARHGRPIGQGGGGMGSPSGRLDGEVAGGGLRGGVPRWRRGCGGRRRCPGDPVAGGGEGASEARADWKKKGAGNNSHQRGKKRRRLHRVILAW